MGERLELAVLCHHLVGVGILREDEVRLISVVTDLTEVLISKGILDLEEIETQKASVYEVLFAVVRFKRGELSIQQLDEILSLSDISGSKFVRKIRSELHERV